VGAGATTGGTLDLATLIKPVLTAGELRVVGSTTFEEFKHIEKDRALARRLQKIVVEEPSVDEAIKILQGLRGRYEDHHAVRYTDEALEAAVKLAKRHLRESRLPDSGIDILDEAGARMRLERAAARRRDESAEPDAAIEVAAGTGSPTDGGGKASKEGTPGLSTDAGRTRATDGARRGQPKGVRPAAAGALTAEPLPEPAGTIVASRDGRTDAGAAAPPDSGPRPVVDLEDIERIVARMARIPEKQANASDKHRLRTIEESLERVVFGQKDAVHAVGASIKRARAGLGQPDRPAGCFLFTGPTGVGKTELAKQLALHLGNEFIRFDMSEYMEKHAVARLIGAPPGYVGFEQGGLLVDAVRQHPYAVLLLDEIEKAHADIFNILLQVMDHATLTDNNGRKADFRQVVLIMTSNAGSREMSQTAIGFAGSGGTQGDELRERAARTRSKSAIERIFSPEFRNRLDAVVTFHALTFDVMETIVEKFILQLEAQLSERRIAFSLTPEARAWLAKKGYDPVFGARPLARVIQTEVRDPLTDEILFGRLENGGTVTIGLGDDRLAFEITPAETGAATT
jgi:ATP-dependent Clp protease ATP-binding subunit ClpA